MELTNKNILVTYFSHTGENYFGGKIVDIEKGNTHILAEYIAEICGADMFEIKPVKAYSHSYTPCTEEAKEELRANARPELAKDIDISAYDVIFIGFPNWWGTMPMPVWTFLEKHDLTGKIVLPFCTHEGSRMGNSEKDLSKLAAGATLKKGLPIQGSYVKNAKDDVAKWLEEV